MLNKRAHVLLSEETWSFLESEAKCKETSVNALIRAAIDAIYKAKIEEKRKKQVSIVDKIRAWHKKVGISKGIDYKEMIEYGRRY